MITEAFLQYIWRLRRFDTQNLLTTNTHETVEILQTGELNKQSGPDFFNARIRIGDTVWAGNVEIHIKTSDWLKHQHQHDKAYQNIILHVVYEADVPLLRADGSVLPVVELQNRISPVLYRNYQQLQYTEAWVPCAKLIKNIDSFVLTNWLDRVLVERLEQKTEPLLQTLQQNNYSWEETCYQAIARAFGTNINAQPFEMLARSLPLAILGKHKDQLLQLEAMLFGQAGLLDKTFDEPYPQKLKQEYQFLQAKFGLKPLLAHSWKTGGLRPPNFPTVRIAQFAALIHQSSALFSKILAAQTPDDYRQLFKTHPSDYWLTHYVFGKTSKPAAKTLGANSIDGLIINTIVPLLFVYGAERGAPEFQDKALELLQAVAAESNSIVDEWKAILGTYPIKTAADTQALLQLKHHYCNEKRCLLCMVGNKIMEGGR